MGNFRSNEESMLEMNLEVLSHRLSKPLFAMLEGIEWKFFLASGFTVIQKYLYQIFQTDIQLILSLAVLLILDFITGVYASIKAKKPITSLGFRSTVVKTIEYIVLLSSITVIGNMSPQLDWVITWGYIFICMTELKSIAENIPATKWFFDKFWEVVKSKNNVDVR